MATWEDFEIECTEYLNKRFGAYAKFIHQGGADSTVPDILVKTKTGATFYIDAKHSPAQCGQFVLLPNIETSTFEYSRQNANRLNAYATRIMEYMNYSFDEYREAGTAGKDIDMPDRDEVFSKWVIDTYKSKGARFFITNGFTILPIEQFQRYFDIAAKYRIKRSGSSSVGKSRIEIVSDYISKHNYSVVKTRTEGDKLFVSSSKYLHDQRFILNAYEYMFSLRGQEYEIRKSSNTYNANVIFSIVKKEHTPGLSDSEFISALQQ